MAGTRETAKVPIGPFEPFSTRRHKAIHEEVQALEKLRMQQALATTGGVRIHAAALLEMPLRTFVTKLRAYGITDRGREDQ